MGKTVKNQSHRKLFENIKTLVYEARNAVVRNINTAMVMTYFEIGRMIVKHEQEGAKRECLNLPKRRKVCGYYGKRRRGILSGLLRKFVENHKFL